jgi:hypothetical protein
MVYGRLPSSVHPPLQVLYGFTKGPLASVTVRAMNQKLMIDSYRQELLSYFIPPRVMLPLLPERYFWPQRPGRPWSIFVMSESNIPPVFIRVRST